MANDDEKKNAEQRKPPEQAPEPREQGPPWEKIFRGLPGIQFMSDITDPPPVLMSVRSYPRTGGTLRWLSQLNAQLFLHQLRVLKTTDLMEVQAVDLSAPNLDGMTGEYFKMVDLNMTTINTVYWFELGVKLTPGTTVEHRVHRVRVRIAPGI